MASGNYDEAASRLNNAVLVEPDNADARRLRGELALRLGDYAGAVDELERARALGVSAEVLALALADAYTSAGQAEEALQLLNTVDEAVTRDPLYWTLRAEALFRLGLLGEAEAALESGARIGDGGARAEVVRSRVALARGNVTEAEAVIRNALSRTPEDPLLLTVRGDVYSRTERQPQAAADYLRAADLYRAVSLDFREAAVLLSLVQVHLAANDLDAAEATAARLAESAPDAALTAYFRALVEYRRGRFDEAAALVQPLVIASPDTIQFRSLLGAIHLARGNFFQAEQQFLTVLAVAPRDPAAVKLLAETRLRQERPEAALEALRIIEGAAAEDPQVGLLSGLASLLAGNAEQGLVYLEQAASLDPANELLKLQLARAYLAVGRDADAAALLRGASGATADSLEVRLMRLFSDLRTGDAAATEASAADLLAEFPAEPRALTAVAVSLQLRGETERARELFERAAELETEGATARLFVAAALVQEGRSQDAERLLARVVDEQPNHAQALTALAELLATRGAFDEAAALLTRAAESSTAIGPRLALAQLRIRQGQLMEARQDLELAVRAAPEDPNVIAVQGILALAEGQSQGAVTYLQRAVAALPNRLGITLALARAQLASGAAADAKTTLQRVLERAPRSLPLRLALGQVELQLGNAAEAVSIAGALKAEFPTQSAGYLLEADAQMATRRYASAVASLASAYERESTWRVLARYVGALQLADQRADALRVSQEWADANPAHVPARLMLAGLFQQEGRSEDALGAYQAVLRLDPNNVAALNNAAWLSRELSRPGALALAERAHALAGDNAAVLDTLGWILIAENRESEAVTHLSRAAELAPGAPEIRYHLAAALAAAGRGAEARSQLTSLLEGNAEFPQRDEARRLRDSL
jgi:putative PEP-CTERM system TPR-repeat lipoprotein